MKSQANTEDENNGKLCDVNELPLQDAGIDKLISIFSPADFLCSAGLFYSKK